MKKCAMPIEPATVRPHVIHGDGRVWAETNCYVDIWIELLHALGHEPIAALPFTLGIDFEGDQWTFFKFPPADLYELYGLVVQELAIWRPLTAHIEEQIDHGHPVLVELDSFYLPDTAGTAYGCSHVKSTAAIVEIDVVGRRAGYFHGRGFYSLHGEDFLDALRLREPCDPATLPPYVEFVKTRRPAATPGISVATSLGLLRTHLSLAPDANPFVGFKARVAQDLETLLGQDLEAFHQYSFATVRQFGACYELSATYLRWLSACGEPDLEGPARAFQDLSEQAKAFEFLLARAIARKRPLNLCPIDAMAARWADGMTALKDRYL